MRLMDRFVQQSFMQKIYDRVDLLLCHAVPVSRLGPEIVHDLQRLVVDSRGLGDLSTAFRMALLLTKIITLTRAALPLGGYDVLITKKNRTRVMT